MKALGRMLCSSLLLILCSPSSLYGQSSPTWIADSKGCKVWNPNPRPNESISWSGGCNQGFATGEGTVEWLLEGRSYATSTGTYQEGKLHGKGVTVGMNGDRYEGDFSDGTRHGRGILTSTNGTRYEGDFLNGKFHGKGFIQKPSGERLESDFIDGKANGNAVVIRPDGTRIAGITRDGKFIPESLASQSPRASDSSSSSTGDSLFHDSHSVESIRTALKGAIPVSILQQARQFDDHVLRSGKVGDQPVTLVTDARSDRATQIVSRLLTAIRVDPSKWVIRVLDTNPPTENAFVVGGNYIYVYTGLVNNAQTDDELAFVLGHEISHSWLKHGMRRGEDFTNLLGTIVELSGAFTRNAERREQRALVGGTIKSAYSRQDEQEADALGAYIAKRASYDPIRGVGFFNRLISQESAWNKQNQTQLAKAKSTVDQQIANCERLRAQWNSSPQIRTSQNAQIVNSTCQTASANAEKYNAYVKESSRNQIKSALLATHPADRDRISALAAAVDYLHERRSLNSLSGIGQGYNVFVAMNLK